MQTVLSALNSTGFKRVLVTGHSLGAAIASLDAVMLRSALPKEITVDSVVFGLPRVGDQKWAALLDKLVRSSHYAVTVHFRGFSHDGLRCVVAELPARHEPERPGAERASALHQLPAPRRRGPHYRRR